MRENNQSIKLNSFASNLIQNRVNFNHLSNENPIGNIKTMDRQKFSLNINEWKKYTSTSIIIISRILVEFFSKFEIIKNIQPKHIPHKYSNEMSKKSLLATLPIIDADEINYSDFMGLLWDL